MLILSYLEGCLKAWYLFQHSGCTLPVTENSLTQRAIYMWLSSVSTAPHSILGSHTDQLYLSINRTLSPCLNRGTLSSGFSFSQASCFKRSLSLTCVESWLSSHTTNRKADAHRGWLVHQNANHSWMTETSSKFHEGKNSCLFASFTVVSQNSAGHMVGTQLIFAEQMNKPKTPSSQSFFFLFQ